MPHYIAIMQNIFPGYPIQNEHQGSDKQPV